MLTIAITHDFFGKRVYPGDVVRRPIVHSDGKRNGYEYRKVVAVTKKPPTKYVLVRRKQIWNT